MIQVPRALLLGALAVGIAASGVLAQGEEPKRDPALKDTLKTLEKASRARHGEQDDEAMKIVDDLLKSFEKMHPKDQNAVRKAVGEILTSPRIRRDPEHLRLFNQVAVALGRMGTDASRILVKAYNSSKFKDRDWIAMRAVILKSIGKTKDERQIKFLIDEASRDPSDKIMQAAGDALGNFEGSDQKVRKDIVKELTKKFSEIEGKSKANLNPGDPQVARAKETLAAISREWNESLRKLTGQSHTSAADWQHFYNKNKNKDWDKLK